MPFVPWRSPAEDPGISIRPEDDDDLTDDDFEYEDDETWEPPQEL